MDKLNCAASCLFIAVIGAGCQSTSIPTLISQQEVFDFYYLVLEPDANGLYALSMDLGSGCRSHSFDRNALPQMLIDKEFELTHNIGGRPVTVTASFEFEALNGCNPLTEIKRTTDDLSVPVRDANGQITGRERPRNAAFVKTVDAEFSSAGIMSVLVNSIRVIGQTDGRARAPDSVDLTTVEVPASLVGSIGGTFNVANVTPNYAESTLDNVLSAPDRFTARFSFLAKTDPAADPILLVWDGDMVLRTDL